VSGSYGARAARIASDGQREVGEAEPTLLRLSLRRTYRGRGGVGCLEDSKDGDS
jgi:hypothetical protein